MTMKEGPALAPEGFFAVHQGDARKLDLLLNKAYEPPVLTCTITSPPYWNLKDYGASDQIGFGQPHDEYLVDMLLIFRALHRHTKDDGSLWLIADTLRPEETEGGVRRVEPLPFQLAEVATEAGWILRDTIIWRKDKTLPWSSRGRLRNVFEYVLYFVKCDAFKYHIDRIRDPIRLKEWWVKWPERHNPEGKVPENVWDIPIPVQGSWKNTDLEHMCPLPPDLVERIVLLSTDEDDVVFDPFAGTGVVVAEAQRLNRNALGIELVQRHVSSFARTTVPEIHKRDSSDQLKFREERLTKLRDEILKLRVVKYPKTLMQQAQAKFPSMPHPSLAVSIMDKAPRDALRTPHKLINANVVFLLDGDLEERDAVRRVFKELAEQRPASKFGIVGDIQVIAPSEFSSVVKRKSMYLYRNGRTWKTHGKIFEKKILDLLPRAREGRWPPILSNVKCDQDPRPLDENTVL